MEKTRRAVVIASRPVSAGMRRYVPGGVFVAAADAGWLRAKALGVRVDLAVGDFDSAQAPGGAGELLRLSAEKDDTDTHYAVKELLRRGYGHITLLGALGGRGDHAFANWQTLLYIAKRGGAALAAGPREEVHCLAAGAKLDLPRGGWRWLSVFAAGGPAGGVVERGVKYPLNGAVLTPDVPLGVSNEFAGDAAQVWCETGFLYVMVTR